MFAGKVDDFALIEPGARALQDASSDHFAPTVVWYADDSGAGNRWVLLEHSFDQDARDVFATRFVIC